MRGPGDLAKEATATLERLSALFRFDLERQFDAAQARLDHFLEEFEDEDDRQ